VAGAGAEHDDYSCRPVDVVGVIDEAAGDELDEARRDRWAFRVIQGLVERWISCCGITTWKLKTTAVLDNRVL
jgi:hypothetical protein